MKNKKGYFKLVSIIDLNTLSIGSVLEESDLSFKVKNQFLQFKWFKKQNKKDKNNVQC